MKISIFKDVAKYALTSTITKDDLALVKKYRPDALKIKDADGNDIFGISYVEGRHCVSKNGITFGAVSTTDAGKLMVTGDLPAKLPEDAPTAADYVADIVGAALNNITEIEKDLPAVVADIKKQREELIGSIDSK